MRRQLGSWCSKENFALYTNCFPITLDMIDNTIPLVLRLQMLHDAETLFWYEENEDTYKPHFKYELTKPINAAATGWSKRFVSQCHFSPQDIVGPFPLMDKGYFEELLALKEFNQGRKSQMLWRVFGYFFVKCYFYRGFKLSENEISSELKISRNTLSGCISTLLSLNLLRIKTDYISTKQSRSYLININVYAEPTRNQSQIKSHTFNENTDAEKVIVNQIKMLIQQNYSDEEIAAQLKCSLSKVISVRAYCSKIQMTDEAGEPQIVFANLNDAAAWLIKYQLTNFVKTDYVKIGIINSLQRNVCSYYHKFSFTTAPISTISEQENKKYIMDFNSIAVKNLTTNEIFPTANIAAAQYGYNSGRYIIECCRGNAKTAHGYKWKFIYNFE